MLQYPLQLVPHISRSIYIKCSWEQLPVHALRSGYSTSSWA